MIRPLLASVAAVGALSSAPAMAAPDHPAVHRAPSGLGVGVVVGEPTGLTMASRIGDRSAVQGYATWSLVHDHLRLSADWVPSLAILQGANVNAPIYLGVGGIVAVNGNDPWLGVRVPLGVSFLPHSVPLEPFLEVAPVVGIMPEPDVGLEGVLGLRYYL